MLHTLAAHRAQSWIRKLQYDLRATLSLVYAFTRTLTGPFFGRSGARFFGMVRTCVAWAPSVYCSWFVGGGGL
jgi:hypothetical protein